MQMGRCVLSCIITKFVREHTEYSMEVIKFQGTDYKLYELIGPLVMSPAILRQNNNYPFKTGNSYVWYIAVEQGLVVGFMPVRKTSTDYRMIDNYYIRGDNAAVLSTLLAEVIAGSKPFEIWGMVHKRHVEQFAQNGFRTHIEWKNYHKMQYCRKEDIICTN